MKSHLDCIPCFIRHALQAARFVSDDVAIHEQVVREVLRVVAAMDLGNPPPQMGQYIQRTIRRLTGSEDPYRSVKQQFNQYLLDRLDEFREQVRRSDDPLDTAVRLAIAGNVIDFGPYNNVDESLVDNAILKAFSTQLPTSAIQELREAAQQAGDILFLADNAGEIVFDRLLIEQLPKEKITVAVKGGPALNDVLMEDAEMVGLCELVAVIDNGTDAPGTVLELCSDKFRKRFQAADMIISKGQANYETLSDEPADIFFLLMAKCDVVARDIGCKTGDYIVCRSRNKEAKAA